MADEIREKLLESIKEQGEVVRKLKAAKAESSKAICGIDLKTQLDNINNNLGDISYIGGWLPSHYDKKLYDICIQSLNGEIENFIHLKRWFIHIKSFEPDEFERIISNKKNCKTTLENIVEKLNSTDCGDPESIDKKVRQ